MVFFFIDEGIVMKKYYIFIVFMLIVFVCVCGVFVVCVVGMKIEMLLLLGVEVVVNDIFIVCSDVDVLIY